jgi:hypothetical protein
MQLERINLSVDYLKTLILESWRGKSVSRTVMNVSLRDISVGAVDLEGESMRQFQMFVLENPVEFVRLSTLRVMKYFSLIRPMGFWFYQSGLPQLIFLFASGVVTAVVFTFGLAGLLALIRVIDSSYRYLGAITVLTPLILFITVVETRYKFQIYPMLGIFASWAIFELMERKKSFVLSKPFLASVIFFVVITTVDIYMSFGKLAERLGWFF